jgi:hypothetical protein
MKALAILFGLFFSGFLLLSNGFCEMTSDGSKRTETTQQATPQTAQEKQEPVLEKQENEADAKANRQPAASGENAAAEKPAAETKPPVAEHPLDRRWIMKMEKQPGMPVKKPNFDWTGTNQQHTCEEISGQLAEAYRKARDSSIQGDPCNTARYARQFLEVKAQCRRDCPNGFLEGIGYNETIVRNFGTLLELGARACLGDRPVQKGEK